MSDTPSLPPPEGRFTRALNRLLVKLKVDEVPHIKRVIVTVVGGTVLIFGVFLFFTPGPSVLVIPVGLAILGTEYAWARSWLRNGRKMANKALSRTQRIIGVAKSRRHEKVIATPMLTATELEAAARPPASEIPAAERGEDQPEAMTSTANSTRIEQCVATRPTN